MKKFLPLLFVFAAAGAWFLYLMYQDWSSLDHLKRQARGAMSDFVIFDAKQDAPRTPFLDRNGSSFSFEDFQGKALLVNLWATWCEPCREEMPTLVDLQKVMEGEDFEILTISIDWQGYQVIDPFLEEYQATGLAAYLDKSSRLPNQVGVKGLPLTILINKDGDWIGRLDGPAVWNSADAIQLMRAAARE